METLESMGLESMRLERDVFDRYYTLVRRNTITSTPVLDRSVGRFQPQIMSNLVNINESQQNSDDFENSEHQRGLVCSGFQGFQGDDGKDKFENLNEVLSEMKNVSRYAKGVILDRSKSSEEWDTQSYCQKRYVREDSTFEMSRLQMVDEISDIVGRLPKIPLSCLGSLRSKDKRRYT